MDMSTSRELNMYSVARCIWYVIGMTLTASELAQGSASTASITDGRFDLSPWEQNLRLSSPRQYSTRQDVASKRLSISRPVDHVPKFEKNLFDLGKGSLSPSDAYYATPPTFWTNWSSWTLCSRSCGGGIALRWRKCSNRFTEESPAICKGSTTHHRLCNSRKCPGEFVDFRQMQCSQQDDKLFQGRKYRWVPYPGTYGNGNACELSCIAVDFHFYHTFGIALDGTRCGAEKRDVCIQGQCVRVGCDQTLGSNTTEDACGVCGGKNETCFHFQSVFDQLHSHSAQDHNYNEVARIPIGATHIRVNDFTKNYLALLEGDEHFERYIINGNWVISWPGDFKAGGTVVTYNRESERETFEMAGPTTKDLYVMILYLGHEPLIHFEYWLPNSLKPSEEQSYGELKLHGNDDIENPIEDFSDERYDSELTLDLDEFENTVADTTIAMTLRPTTSIPASTRRQTTATIQTTRPANVSKASGRKTDDFCNPCKRSSNKKKHYCENDFAAHVRIVSKRRRKHGRYMMYDVEMVTVYKTDFKLMRREYIWVPSTCCPRLRLYRQYLLMGRKREVEITKRSKNKTPVPESARRFQTRLHLSHADFWHPWKKSYKQRMSKISNHFNC